MSKRLFRRSFLSGAVAAAAAGSFLRYPAGATGGSGSKKFPTARDTFGLRKQGKRIPVILDTDIGNDIDDTWALAMMLKSPELDVKLVVSDSGNDVYRARIIAKMLQVAKRTDVPVGIGCKPDDKPGRQSKWVGDYTLDDYPGTIHKDGVGAMIEQIRQSPDPVTLVAIGPVPNVAEMLRRAPDVAARCRFVGMHGSVRRGYGNSLKPVPEYNVRADPKALQEVFAAPWDITITPLDTCGIVHLTGEKFRKVYQCPDPLVQALMANYRVWLAARNKNGKLDAPPQRSSTLFDTVAVYLGFSEALLKMEELPIRVTDEGMTVIDPQGHLAHCATAWKDLGAFEDELVRRLTSG